MRRTCLRNILRLILLIVLSSCHNGGDVEISVREAQEVVAQADSLWHAGKMYGIDEGDSATLAQAYETLKNHSAFSRHFSEVIPFVPCMSSLGTFSHACYHYGKLLRTKDDPVSAMQAFIDATHSHTRDYHILGRVYSNMGDICHLAGDYPLSYDMFERSADMYLKNGDSLFYYYCLNDMAYELAIQGKEEETLDLLEYIKQNCPNDEIHPKVTETAANLYLQTKQYKILLSTLNENPNNYSTYYILKAQAYEHLAQVDSAIYYAKKVMSSPYASPQEKYNVLYILINYDYTLSNDDLIALSALRSDIETDVLIPLHNQWAISVQLLQQDLNRKPDYRWLYALLVSLSIIGTSIFIIIRHKRRQHTLLSQQIADLTILNKEAVERQTTLKQNIDTLSHLQKAHHSEVVSQVEQFSLIIQCDQDLIEYLHWNNYEEMCKLSNKYLFNIVNRLQQYHLSQKEIRLCILVLLNSDTKRLVNMIPYSHSGIGKFKYTTSQKLGTSTPNLRTFMLNLLG